MKIKYAIKIIANCLLFTYATSAFCHIVLENKSAPAGSDYKAVFQVGHGCEGSATTALSVQIPSGFQAAKPYPKAGWTLNVQLGKLAQPYTSHGKQISEDVSVVSWTATSPAMALQEAYFDEFMLRGKLTETVGPLWFKVLQTCENGSIDWSAIPASGLLTRGLKSPAALLEVKAPVHVAPIAVNSSGKEAATVSNEKANVQNNSVQLH